MKISIVTFPEDRETIYLVAESAFSQTPDASLPDWFSLTQMELYVAEHRGICLKAVSDVGKTVGMIYAQQENPVNGKEGLEKWVIVIAAVLPEATGSGVGTTLLQEIEKQAQQQGASKMFVYTNRGDEKVVNFYQKNGYEDAGWIRDYQYGKGNSAVFLLKYL